MAENVYELSMTTGNARTGNVGHQGQLDGYESVNASGQPFGSRRKEDISGCENKKDTAKAQGSEVPNARSDTHKRDGSYLRDINATSVFAAIMLASSIALSTFGVVRMNEVYSKIAEMKVDARKQADEYKMNVDGLERKIENLDEATSNIARHGISGLEAQIENLTNLDGVTSAHIRRLISEIGSQTVDLTDLIEAKSATQHQNISHVQSVVLEALDILRRQEADQRNQNNTVKLDKILEEMKDLTPFKSVIRLVEGGVSISGRVEIFHQGVWGTICDDSWDINDARVVCRMLGYSNAVSAPRTATYGQGTGPIHLDEVRCTGAENSIWDCTKNSWGYHDCTHSEDASVECSV